MTNSPETERRANVDELPQNSGDGRAEELFARGNALRRLARNREAIEAYDGALAIRPDYAEALNNRGNALRDLKRFEEALESYDRALAANPAYERAHNNRGNTLRDLERHGEALVSFEHALVLKPDYAEAMVNRGNALRDLKRFEEALESYDRALALRPDWAPALNNRGLALMDLERHGDALACFERALSAEPKDAELRFHRGNALLRLQRHEEAIAEYERVLSLAPAHAWAWNNLGNALLFLRRADAALACYGRALAAEPGNAQFLNNRGHAWDALGRRPEALADYQRAYALNPDYTDALYAAAQTLRDLKRTDEAIACAEKVLELDPDFGVGALVDLKRAACDWNGIAELEAKWIADVRAGKGALAPFTFFAVSDTQADHLRCAEIFLGAPRPGDARTLWNGERYNHDKIRIAYLTADFHEHATAYLTAGLFEHHDRTKFETVAISWGPNEKTPIRRRAEAAFDRFIEAGGIGDRAVAERLRAMEIDIAVNLMGYTRNARTAIFAPRPAPVQVSYLGYPGTMGAPFMDYLIADRIVVPKEDERYYTEKIAALPHTYQPNDDKKILAASGTRAAAGLPDDAFVFCSFNNSNKITPDIFGVWMRLLRAVENSVLWLIDDGAIAVRNLRREAEARGVAAERLIFAPRLPMPEHLARHRLADVFLDTRPYNAHTTASDALWAGLPVVTCTGATFAARVATSLLHAVGLPELATATLADYEALAINLARDRDALATIRERLARNRQTHPLFDTGRYCRHLETAFATMHERRQRGEAPASFDVAAEADFPAPM